MKKFLVLIIIFSFLGCSQDDNSSSKKTIPEKFNIKIEIKNTYGSSPKVSISVNSLVVKQWTYIDIPFENSYVYYTTGKEIENSGCKCINISAWAYLSKIYGLESFNLYIDGKLVKTTNVIAAPESNGIMNPTILDYTYTP